MNYEESQNNVVTVSGEITSEPTFTHSVCGEGFYELTLAVSRLSGHIDVLPITVSERLMEGMDLSLGNHITVNGQFRSYNKLEENRSKLMLTVFARNVTDYDEEDNPNRIEVKGFLCKPPMYRTTPFKREICDLLVAVNRSYNKSDYIPCIAWGRNARFVNTLNVGDRIEIVGRIQSREYQKNTDDGQTLTKTAYEVSVSGLKADRSEQSQNYVLNPEAV